MNNFLLLKQQNIIYYVIQQCFFYKGLILMTIPEQIY